MVDYAAITNEHRLDYGRKVAHYGRILADMLYSDRTHFIYELLQNAEDAGAKWIAFALYNDRLEVRHNGRPFNENDVRAICSIGEGTKADDMTKVGKFGIGFKSVYAHTRSPNIHSDGEHFVIIDFVFPEACTPIDTNSGETLIIIPFDRGGSEAQMSYDHIAKRLSALNSQTLLFLHSVQEIKWDIVNHKSGHYLRQTRQIDASSARWIDILDEFATVENWLVFSSSVSFDNHLLRVEIAFSIETNPNSGKMKIRRITNSKLVVFFPTGKQVHFNFLMQGPYRTTPSRDNIVQNHPLNQALIKETGHLIFIIADKLLMLGLLDANAIDVLRAETPPTQDWEFKPIYSSIINAFMSKKILPTTTGKFVTASDAKLARSQELNTLFDEQRLPLLFPANPTVSWLHESITRDNFPNLHHFLREQIKIEEITPEKLVGLPTLPDLIVMQSDEWLIKFYTFLLGRPALWDYAYCPLRKVAFIRLENGTHVKPFKGDNNEPNVYLPVEGRDTAFPTVRKQIIENVEARKFLERLGLREPDVTAEVLELILPKYEGSEIDVDDDTYLSDLEAMVDALSQEDSIQKNTLVERIAMTTVILSKNALKEGLWYTTPKFAIEKNGEFDFLYYDDEDAYYINEIIPERIIQIFKDNGLLRPSPIRAGIPDWKERIQVASRHGWHVRGLKGFDPNCKVEGLERALSKITVERAKAIWNQLLLPHKHHICGVVEISTRQTFEGSRNEERISPMGKLVRQMVWLPDKVGQFHIPSQLHLDDLPNGFVHDEMLAMNLGMIPLTAKKLADEYGIEPDELKWFSQLSSERRRALMGKQSTNHITVTDSPSHSPNQELHSDELSNGALQKIDYENELSSTFDRSGHKALTNNLEEQHDVGNPQRRMDRIKEQIAQSHTGERNTDKTSPTNNVDLPAQLSESAGVMLETLTHFKIMTASVVSTNRWQGKDPQTRTFLLQQYAGQCQICGETFPRRKDGQAYFEGVYMVQRSKGQWIDRPGNVLCLCANHAAQFLHGSVEGDTFVDQVLSSQTNSSEYRFNLELCGKTTLIRFTQRHLLDLMALLEYSQANKL